MQHNQPLVTSSISQLAGAVRRALARRCAVATGALLTAGLAAMAPPTMAGPFPPEIELSSLLGGGDASTGFVLTGISFFDGTGRSISGAGDVNGDGIDDLIVGAPDALDGNGQCYVVFGSNSAFPAIFDFSSLFPANGGDGSTGFVLTGTESNSSDRACSSVSAAGDVNGDGIDDVIVGAPNADAISPGSQSSSRGRSYVVFGTAAGFEAELELSSLESANGGDGSAGFVLNGIDPVDKSGNSVSAAGDVNGDGIDDLIIGA